jgi:uncharacterized membrane protein YphA (DoxX/SURF4 family)
MLFGVRPATIKNTKAAVVWLRICSSFAWLDSAFVGKEAKFAPAFLHGGGLVSRVHTTFAHTAIDSRVVQLLDSYVVPHAALFALLIAAADAVAGVSLSLGVFVRLGAAVAIVRALVNIAVAGRAGTDTIGFNLMLVVAAAICIATAAGRKFGIDAWLIDRFPRDSFLRLFA